jgi:hypothetical protein
MYRGGNNAERALVDQIGPLVSFCALTDHSDSHEVDVVCRVNANVMAGRAKCARRVVRRPLRLARPVYFGNVRPKIVADQQAQGHAITKIHGSAYQRGLGMKVKREASGHGP